MPNTDFDEFVKRQQEDASRMSSLNWRKERDEWLQHLSQLYSQVESFLSKYISAKQISKEYRTIELNEEYIGSYQVKELVLKVGRQEVKLVPIGRMVIGAKGRVDVVGPAGTVQLLLVGSKATRGADLIRVEVNIGGKSLDRPRKTSEPIVLQWKILTRLPQTRFIELSQERFFELLMEVGNG